MANEEEKSNDFYEVLGLKKECELRYAYKSLFFFGGGGEGRRRRRVPWHSSHILRFWGWVEGRRRREEDEFFFSVLILILFFQFCF